MNEEITLEINPDTVRYIISMAREFHVQEQVSIPEDPMSPSGDWAMQILASQEGDATQDELKIAIRDLEPDQQVQLVALMWLGRGSFSVGEWQAALKEAGDNWNANTAEYLIGTPLVADYLEEGLNQIGY
jgi:hypothetical protein